MKKGKDLGGRRDIISANGEEREKVANASKESIVIVPKSAIAGA